MKKGRVYGWHVFEFQMFDLWTCSQSGVKPAGSIANIKHLSMSNAPKN